MAPTNSNGGLVHAVLSAWERRDTRFILEQFTDDAVYHAVPLRPIVGKPALEPWVRSFERYPRAGWRYDTRWSVSTS